MSKLTAKTVSGRLGKGLHNDGDGLYLRVSDTGAKSWVLRTRVHGKKREIGLGGAKYVSLSDARKEARRLREIARTGGDPLAERRRQNAIPTLEQAAKTVWREQIEPTARNEKHKAQWINSLRDYIFPRIGDRRVDTVQSSDVLSVLQPIWLEKPETARRVRQRLRTIFDWTIAAQHRRDANPLAGIEKALPRQTDRPSHHRALPYAEVPALYARLSAAGGVASIALQFLILTAARSGEVRGATWEEIDEVKRIWTLPAVRMKAGSEHRVPLSTEAISLVNSVQGLNAKLLFPGHRRASKLSDMSMTAVLRRMSISATVHGFRTSFRTWAAETTDTPREVAELSLAHKVGNAVERAYARTDLFERRRELMEHWGRFCSSAVSGKAVSLADDIFPHD